PAFSEGRQEVRRVPERATPLALSKKCRPACLRDDRGNLLDCSTRPGDASSSPMTTHQAGRHQGQSEMSRGEMAFPHRGRQSPARHFYFYFPETETLPKISQAAAGSTENAARPKPV